MSSPLLIEAQETLRAVMDVAPVDDPKLQARLQSLADLLERASEDAEKQSALLAEFETAYEKLTAPANRIGVFLQWLESGNAMIAVGDNEFIATANPSVSTDDVGAGDRIYVNEAYAILGPALESKSGPLAKIDEVHEERLKIGGDGPGSASRYILASRHLPISDLKTGDFVRLDSSGRFAVEHFPSQKSKDMFVDDVPVTPWSSVKGQDSAIQLIQETIEAPLLHPEIFQKFNKKPIKGILLYGPPGCGKTLLGKATAYNVSQKYSEVQGREVKEYFMLISGPKILNMWLGESERMVRELFQTAREKAKEGFLVFLFIDEAESILRTRSSGRWLNISNTVVPQFCAELDGLVSLENVVVILTSNRPDYIDPAILRPERIDRKIKINRPNKEAARDILGLYFSPDIPLDPESMAKFKCDTTAAREWMLDEAVNLIWQTEKEAQYLRVHLRNGSNETLYWRDFVSGALLKSIVDRAKDSAIRRAVADPDGDHGVSFDDLAAAIRAEFIENEIFPKSDSHEDWLKLLDLEQDNVVSVKPIRGSIEPVKRGRMV